MPRKKRGRPKKAGKRKTGRKRPRVKTVTKWRNKPAAKKTRRRRGASGRVKLSAAGLKRILTPAALIGAAGGALGARAAYGLVKGQAPDLDSKLAAVLSTALAIAVGVMVGKKMKIAGPVAVGACAALVLDILGPEIASAISDSWPAGASAIAVGMGAVEAATPTPALPPGETALTGDYPDAWGMGGESRRYPDAFGMGQLDMVSLMPYMG